MSTLHSLPTCSLVHALGAALLHFLWQGLLVAGLLAFTLRELRHCSAQARYLAACTALVLLAACPLVTLMSLHAPSAPRHGYTQSLPKPQSHAALPSNVFQSPPLSNATPVIAHFQQALSTIRAIASPTNNPLYPPLVAAWLVSVLCLSLRLLGGWLRVCRLTRCGLGSVESNLQDRATDMARRMGIARPVPIVASPWVSVPSVIGCLQAMVLLPVSVLTNLPARQIEAILAHELAHVRRYDYLINLLQTALETLLFYHPATWWVSRQIRHERENCCDDMAVQFCGSRVLYARALAALEDLRCPPASFAMAANGGNLLQRIRRITDRSQPSTDLLHSRGQAVVASLILTALVGVVGLPAALVQASSSSPETRSPVQALRIDARNRLAPDQAQGMAIHGGHTKPSSALLQPLTVHVAGKQESFLAGSSRAARTTSGDPGNPRLVTAPYVPSSGAEASKTFGSGAPHADAGKAMWSASASSGFPQAGANHMPSVPTFQEASAAPGAFAEPRQGVRDPGGDPGSEQTDSAPRPFAEADNSPVLSGKSDGAPSLPGGGASGDAGAPKPMEQPDTGDRFGRAGDTAAGSAIP